MMILYWILKLAKWFLYGCLSALIVYLVWDHIATNGIKDFVAAMMIMLGLLLVFGFIAYVTYTVEEKTGRKI